MYFLVKSLKAGNARRVVPEGQEKAQYEVLGNDARRDVRPVRDDRNVQLPVSRMQLHERKQPSIVPSGTLFSETRTQHFVLGFIGSLPPSPSGLWRTGRDQSLTLAQRSAIRPYIDAHGQPSEARRFSRCVIFVG